MKFTRSAIALFALAVTLLGSLPAVAAAPQAAPGKSPAAAASTTLVDINSAPRISSKTCPALAMSTRRRSLMAGPMPTSPFSRPRTSCRRRRIPRSQN